MPGPVGVRAALLTIAAVLLFASCSTFGWLPDIGPITRSPTVEPPPAASSAPAESPSSPQPTWTTVPDSPTPSPSSPQGFDPAAPLWAGAVPTSADDSGGVWTAHVDGSDRYEWSDSPDAYVTARLLDGVIWEEYDRDRGRNVLHMGRAGSPARLLTSRAWGFGSDATSDAFYTSLATRTGDDGLWRFPLDGSPPMRMIPALPRAFERGLTPMSVAVSDDGTKLVRTFAAGDLDMGGSSWVVQVLSGRRLWTTSFESVYDFSADDQLVIELGAGIGIYDLATRRVRPDPRDWSEFPFASPDERWTATLAADHVTINDRSDGTSREVAIPKLDLRSWWLTNDALVLEEQTSDTDAYPSGVGRHLVMDVQTGWYRFFDPIAPPVD
jgi:hypothetical protein